VLLVSVDNEIRARAGRRQLLDCAGVERHVLHRDGNVVWAARASAGRWGDPLEEQEGTCGPKGRRREVRGEPREELVDWRAAELEACGIGGLQNWRGAWSMRARGRLGV
jgi:hypothetical protein